MSSFARAERRRQERAAARQPAEVDGLSLIRQRGETDCMRAAVAMVLGVDYDETPDVVGNTVSPYVGSEAFTAAWDAWASERGLVRRQFYSHAPAFAPAWIAVVAAYGRDDLTHMVAMSRARLAHDPTPVDEARRRVVNPADVRQAVIFGTPEWIDGVEREAHELVAKRSPLMWPITRPLDTPQGVRTLHAQGRHAEADAMQQRIARRATT